DVAVAAVLAAEGDLAVPGGPYRRAGGRGVVDAAMRADRVQHRMPAFQVEVRADPCEIDRGAEEGLADAASVRSEVVAASGFVRIASRPVYGAAVHEFSGDDLAVAELHAVAIVFLVDHRERIAGA